MALNMINEKYSYKITREYAEKTLIKDIKYMKIQNFLNKQINILSFTMI